MKKWKAVMEFAKRTELRIRQNGERSLSCANAWLSPARGSPLPPKKSHALVRKVRKVMEGGNGVSVTERSYA